MQENVPLRSERLCALPLVRIASQAWRWGCDFELCETGCNGVRPVAIPLLGRVARWRGTVGISRVFVEKQCL